MARVRNIKPGFFLNEDLADLDPYARLLFIGLWSIADREGKLEDKPRTIKAKILPFDDVGIDKLLSDLAANNRDPLIVRYEVDGFHYIKIPKFLEHQNPHRKETPSKIPEPQTTENKEDTKSPNLGQYKHQPRTVQAPDKDSTSRADPDPDPDPDPDQCQDAPSGASSQKLACADFFTDENFKRLRDSQKEAHPKAPPIGESAKKELINLVKLDDYTQDEVTDCLEWLYLHEPEGEFMWRDQLRSYTTIRKRCKNGYTKFENIYEKWQKHKKTTNKKELLPWQKAQIERDKQKYGNR